MKVVLLASTQTHTTPDSISGSEFSNYFWKELVHSSDFSDADTLAHLAGRACYQSWGMPNPATATNEGYLANILEHEHYSVLEHASATFYAEGVSRNLTHELIRHRHLSFSELSQRYVDMNSAPIIVPPAVEHLGAERLDTSAKYDTVMAHAKQHYREVVETLEGTGVRGKKAREAARSLLPSGIETKIVVTGNHRAWRDMLKKRYSVHADAEMQEFAAEVLRILKMIAPATYQDFPEIPFG